MQGVFLASDFKNCEVSENFFIFLVEEPQILQVITEEYEILYFKSTEKGIR